MRRLAATLSLLLLHATLVSGQTASSPHWVYKLDKESSFQRGCFEPCMCPILASTALRGTFKLTPTGSDWLFDYYSVTGVNWMTTVEGSPTRITGSGIYRIGGEVAIEQWLELDLAVGEEPAQHFSSGRVFGAAGFPRIDLMISINGVFCFDTVMTLVSEPVPSVSVEPAELWWESFLPPPGASYDVVMGDLSSLRSSGGLGSSVQACLADDFTAPSQLFTAAPPPGEGFWLLVRESSSATARTYDGGDVGQVGSRDAEIASSPASCP